jgi:hypothetical protein
MDLAAAFEVRHELIDQITTVEPRPSRAAELLSRVTGLATTLAAGALATASDRGGTGDLVLADRHGGAADAVMKALSRGPAPLAVGIAPTTRKGDYRIAVRIQDFRAMRSPELQLVREYARDEVDIQFIGRIRAHGSRLWYRSATRPLAIGASIAHENVTAGTLGCFVERDSEVRALSANHVLANENEAQRGDPILQPARKDGGRPRSDIVGTFDHGPSLTRDEVNDVDCALAVVEPAFLPDDLGSVAGLGAITGLATQFPDENEAVEKIGRTTGHTLGRITSFELTPLRLGYRSGDFVFDKLMEIEGAATAPFSRPGDSGAVIFTSRERKGRGLLVGGTAAGGANGKGLTYASSLSTVLERLGATLLA